MYLKGYVLASKTNLQLLATVLVLLGPLGVIFPVTGQYQSNANMPFSTYLRISLSLTMRLISETRASLTHTDCISRRTEREINSDTLTFFADQRVIAVVGVVGITCRRATAITEHTEIELYRTVSRCCADAPNRTDRGIHGRIVLGDPSCVHVSTEHVH
jgi:hypothetical protein